MDDTKISHVDHIVVTSVIKTLEESFVKITMDRGKKHKFIGMDFELTGDGRLRIIMKQYLEEFIESFGDDIKTTIISPGGHNLFHVDESLDRLDTKSSKIFNHIVAKLLFYPRELG